VFRFEDGSQFLHGFFRWDFAHCHAQTSLLRFPGKLKLRTGSLCAPIRTKRQLLRGLRRPDDQGLLLADWHACHRPAYQHLQAGVHQRTGLRKSSSPTSTTTSFESLSATTASTTSTGKHALDLTNPTSTTTFYRQRVSGVYNSDMAFAKISQWHNQPPLRCNVAWHAAFCMLAKCAVTRLTPQSFLRSTLLPDWNVIPYCFNGYTGTAVSSSFTVTWASVTFDNAAALVTATP